MSVSINRVELFGNLGQDPEIRRTPSGTKIGNLSIATSESWKDKDSGQWKEKVEWHRVVVFNDGLVNVIEKYLAKGDKVHVVGQLQTRKWEDQNGQTRYSTEIAIRPYRGELKIERCKAWDKNKRNGGDGGYSDSHDVPPQDAPSHGALQSSPQPQSQPARSARDEMADEIPF
jgi:single-strand DNA-binding protein